MLRKVIIVADHTKFGRGGMIPVAPLNAADVVISDTGLTEEFADLLRANDVKVMIA